MPFSREVKEGMQIQGAEEEIAYTIDVTNWGSSPSLVTVKAFDLSTDPRTDVTATVLSGSSSINGNIITLPVLADLTAGKFYRVEVKFTCSGNIFECHLLVRAET